MTCVFSSFLHLSPQISDQASALSKMFGISHFLSSRFLIAKLFLTNRFKFLKF